MESVEAPNSGRIPEGTDVLAALIDRCSNWGRWGADDEIGTLNHVGPDQVRNAATLVRRGHVIALSLAYDQNGCQDGGFRQNPQLFVRSSGTDYVAGHQEQTPWGPGKGFGFSDDVVILPTQAGTQWDSLSHIFYGGQMYNGRDAAESTAKGSSVNGIQAGLTNYVMRGVLLDIARYRGVDALDPGYAISADELDAVAAFQNVEIRKGDAVLVRTGFLGQRRGRWGDYAGGAAPGLSLYTAPWFYEHEIAAVATDTWGVEVRPNEVEQVQPFHTVALVHMGLALGEIFDLDALGAHCAEDGMFEFQFVGPPLPLSGASGSPLSALAIK